MGKQLKTPSATAADIMRALENIVSDDLTRSNLAHVQVRREGAAARVTATDGHCLVTALFRDEAIVQALTDGMTGNEAYALPREARQRAIGVSIPWVGLEYPYPQWEQVVPMVDGNENGCRTIGVNPDLLSSVLVAVRRLMTAAGAERRSGVTIHVGDDALTPIKITTRTHEFEATAVVMPMRL